jgi:hypothetical protein
MGAFFLQKNRLPVHEHGLGNGTRRERMAPEDEDIGILPETDDPWDSDHYGRH